jgi:hypothetical protein
MGCCLPAGPFFFGLDNRPHGHTFECLIFFSCLMVDDVKKKKSSTADDEKCLERSLLP